MYEDMCIYAANFSAANSEFSLSFSNILWGLAVSYIFF